MKIDIAWQRHDEEHGVAVEYCTPENGRVRYRVIDVLTGDTVCTDYDIDLIKQVAEALRKLRRRLDAEKPAHFDTGDANIGTFAKEPPMVPSTITRLRNLYDITGTGVPINNDDATLSGFAIAARLENLEQLKAAKMLDLDNIASQIEELTHLLEEGTPV